MQSDDLPSPDLENGFSSRSSNQLTPVFFPDEIQRKGDAVILSAAYDWQSCFNLVLYKECLAWALADAAAADLRDQFLHLLELLEEEQTEAIEFYETETGEKLIKITMAFCSDK